MKRLSSSSSGFDSFENFRKVPKLSRCTFSSNRICDSKLITKHICHGKHCCPETLSSFAAKVTAASVPFELVEERYPRVPEPVLMKLITWSFPRSEEDIRRYSAIGCLSNHVVGRKLNEYRSDSDHESEGGGHSYFDFDRRDAVSEQVSLNQTGTFQHGALLASSGAVLHAIQIGFHLSGKVCEKKDDSNSSFTCRNTHLSSRLYNVAVTFDRCKVTSWTCNCQNGDGIFFCRHVVAVLLFRLRFPSKVKIRVPISDSLQQLNRDQLQKLTQYLVARHSHILPTAQEIADMICDPTSTINKVHGAPDPTAGASYNDDDRWSLNDRHVSRYIRNILAHPNKQCIIQSLQNMLKKIEEMMKVRDCNARWLLARITEELVRGGRALETCSLRDAYQNLWDDIGALWVCTVLNRDLSYKEKDSILRQLKQWAEDSRCPLSSEAISLHTAHRSNRTVLSLAIRAGCLTWNDPHLNFIISSKNNPCVIKKKSSDAKETSHYNEHGHPLWCEHDVLAAARVEALRCYGYQEEAVKLALATVRAIKKENDRPAHTHPRKANSHELEVGFGNSLEPIITLYDTLTSNHLLEVKQRLKCELDVTLASLSHEAFEVALYKLGEQRLMPSSSRAQEKILSREKDLIERLSEVELNEKLFCSLKEITLNLLEGRRKSGLGPHVLRTSVPVHLFGSFLFNALLPRDKTLAFRVGLRSMRMPVLDPPESSPDLNHHSFFTYKEGSSKNISPYTECLKEKEEEYSTCFFPSVWRYSHTHLPSYPSDWSVMENLEMNQFQLAAGLLQAAKGEVLLLKSIVQSIQRHMKNSSHVFDLSKEAFRNAAGQSSNSFSPDSTLLNVSMHLVMQVLWMTLDRGSRQRREMVGWLVTCATEIGLCALLTMIKDWSKLFTPVEACTVVAACVISPNTAMRLNLDPRQREDLYRTVCQMTLQCAKEEPQSCALCSLTLSETCPATFDELYNLIIEAADSRRIDSQQLYTIARYLDQRGIPTRAFKVAFRATKRLRVPSNHETHPAATDLLWTTQLAQSLGLKELEELILIIVNKVRCPSVLSDVLRTCTALVHGRMNNYLDAYGNRNLRADRPPLRPLLEASISAYISTIHNKLSHISPRHYAEFINFLNKARETFLLAPDGHYQFARLLANLKAIYKGKKKLLTLVAVRFG